MTAAYTSWILLAYQLPSRPSNARVATWRRLQRVGAVQVHGSVYVLPATAEAREDMEWIAEEVVGGGGQATLFVAETTEARARDQIVEAFRRSRAAEYEAIRAEALEAASAGAGGAAANRRSAASAPATAEERSALAARLRERLAAAAAIDFFAAAGRE